MTETCAQGTVVPHVRLPSIPNSPTVHRAREEQRVRSRGCGPGPGTSGCEVGSLRFALAGTPISSRGQERPPGVAQELGMGWIWRTERLLLLAWAGLEKTGRRLQPLKMKREPPPMGTARPRRPSCRMDEQDLWKQFRVTLSCDNSTPAPAPAPWHGGKDREPVAGQR